jgi:HD-like signal output (HDOD) protein
MMVATTPGEKAKPRIGETLLEAGLISARQLDVALAHQREHGGKLVETLIALGFLERTDFVAFLSKQPGIASISLPNYVIPHNIIALVPRDFALEHEVLPLDKLGPNLILGMACPLNSLAIQKLEQMTGLKVKPILVSMTDMHKGLKHYYASEEKKTWDDLHLLPKRQGPVLPAVPVPLNAASPGRSVLADRPSAPQPEDSRQHLLAQAETALYFASIPTLVRQISDLPVLSDTVRRIQEEMGNAEVSVAGVAAIINRDPALAAKMLALTNSAAFGLAFPVESVSLAITLLGLREVFSLVLSCAVLDYLEKLGGFDYSTFRKRAAFCAAATCAILRATGEKGNQSAFSAGLLHDLGRVVFAQVLPRLHSQIDPRLCGEELVAAEEALFGLAHPEAGYLLATEWSLPPTIAQSIRFHHNVQQAEMERSLVAAVGLASRLTDVCFNVDILDPREYFAPQVESGATLGLTEDQLIDILEASRNYGVV